AGDDAVHAAELEIALSLTLATGFDFGAAYRHVVQALELADQTNYTALQAEALAMKETVSLLSGHGVDEHAVKRALLLEDPDHDAPFQLRVSFNAACVYEYIGRPDIARPMFIRVRNQLTSRGEERDLPWVLGHLAGTSMLLGDFEEAEEQSTEAARVAAFT